MTTVFDNFVENLVKSLIFSYLAQYFTHELPVVTAALVLYMPPPPNYLLLVLKIIQLWSNIDFIL